MLVMAISSSSATFRYQPLLEDQFRILEIVAVQPDICAELLTCVAGQSPPFSALSYAWGNEPNTIAINCDNAKLLVTPHLHACLVSIFQINGPTRLWVDAICIDQNSDHEKAAQVTKMHRLYHGAETVYVWLGIANDRSDEVTDAIKDVKLPPDVKYQSIEDMQDRLLRLKSQAPKLFSVDLFEPMVALSRRSWFQRLWIVQEYLLARSVVFLCGNKTVDGTKLTDTLRKLSIYSFDGDVALDQEEDIFEGYQALRNLDQVKAGLNDVGTLTFFDFVMLGRSRLAKEPVDRIYAMLGLARESDEIYTAKLPIDYSAKTRTEYWQVFAKFGKIALRSEPHLRLLSVTSSVERPEKLPSWCPNFCSPAQLGLLDEVYVFAAGWPWKNHFSNIGPGGCTGHSHFKSPEESHVIVTDDSDVISIWGARLDCIQATIEKDGWNTWEEPNSLEIIRKLAHGLLEWLMKCDKFCITHGRYDTSLVLGRTAWNSILVHRTSVRTRPGEESSSIVSASDSPSQTEVVENLPPEETNHETDTVYVYLIETLIALLELKPEEEQTELAKKYVSDFEVLWTWLLFLDQSWDGRALLATKDGYLGCASNDIAAGDIVCLLYGGRTLYVLREEEEGYRFIGEAYVYDCMGGEIFEMLDDGSIREETFLIH